MADEESKRVREGTDPQNEAKKPKSNKTSAESWNRASRAGPPSTESFDTLTASQRHNYEDASATPVAFNASIRWDGHTPSMATPFAGAEPTAGGFTGMGGTAMTKTPVQSGFDGTSTLQPPSENPWADVGFGPGSSGGEKKSTKALIELYLRNGPIRDDEVAAMIPQGYELVPQPLSYKPRPASNLSMLEPEGFNYATYKAQLEQHESAGNKPRDRIIIYESYGPDVPNPEESDLPIFGVLGEYKDIPDDKLCARNVGKDEKEKYKHIYLLRLLLRIKNGTPNLRKSGYRHLNQKAKWFGAMLVVNQILDMLNKLAIDEQERHLIIKALNGVIQALEDEVRPYIHPIFVAVSGLLISTDFYTKVEGRDVIANLCRATSKAAMLGQLQLDLDNDDVRPRTAAAVAVVAQTFGLREVMAFVTTVCKTQKSASTRLTGLHIVQKTAELLGGLIVPHLGPLVEAVSLGLDGGDRKMCKSACITIAAVAEAAFPHGIQHFVPAVTRLVGLLKTSRDKALVSIYNAIGSIVPLMEDENANELVRILMRTMVRDFNTSDEEKKKVILRVVRQCASTPGVTKELMERDVLPEFRKNFWGQKMAVASRTYRPLIDTLVVFASKVGVVTLLNTIVEDFKHDDENFRRMTLETCDAVLRKHGFDDAKASVDLSDQLMEGAVHVFSHQTIDDAEVVPKGVAGIINGLPDTTRIHFTAIVNAIKERMRSARLPRLKEQSADLIRLIASTLHSCGEGPIFDELRHMLYEQIRVEENPDPLAGFVSALNSLFLARPLVESDTPLVLDVFNQLKNLLHNHNEKVQEATVTMIGTIASSQAVSKSIVASEWKRISRDLLNNFRAHTKAVRKATANAFGFVADAADPILVVNTLLGNLKQQSRNERVPTTVALAVVADRCEAWTVIPFLMNEYRSPDENVQHGVLKALAFVFEYIGESGKDYVVKLIPLLQDALLSRDYTNRQLACNVIKQITLAVRGCGFERVLIHLLNIVWPNMVPSIKDLSPHFINSVVEVIEAMRVVLGPGVLLKYMEQGMFHPARKVRELYWRIYNNAYIGAQESLVPSYPRFLDDAMSNYRRHELETFL